MLGCAGQGGSMSGHNQFALLRQRRDHQHVAVHGRAGGRTGAVRHAGASHLHPAVLPVLGTGRADRRQAGKIAADRDHHHHGDRDHVAGRHRLPDPEPAGAADRAVLHRHAVDPVRPGEVLGTAVGAQARGIDRWQRPGRDGHVDVDPVRHDRRRTGIHRGRQPRHGGGGVRDHRPGHLWQHRRAADSQGRRRRPEPEDQLEPAAGIAGGAAHGAPAEGGAQRDPGRVLVLVRRYRADLAAAGLRGDQSRRRADPVHLRPRPVLGRHRRRLTAVRKAVGTHGGNRPGAAGCVRHDRVPA
ncbi:hypothetical protein G6F35_012879 [Rhizopus arrhizus]|nr:hypothetical protein G6F35_012879 [Rhizopus arrhizus]